MATLPQTNKLTPSQLSTISPKIRDWCSCHGLLMKSKRNDPHDYSFHHLPVTLLPTPIPKILFDQAMQVQMDFNTVFDIITRKTSFLSENLKRSLQDDEYASKLMYVYNQVLKEGIAQPINFMLTRSDYMLDQSNSNNQLSLKQVEFNTVSVGFIGSSSVVPSLHRYVIRELGLTDDYNLERIATNNCLEPAKAMQLAWKLYGNDKAIILFVISKEEYNTCDQRLFEYAVMDSDPSINVVRCTMADIEENATLGDDKTLYYKKQGVALVYYRSAYAPYCYPSQKEWDALLLAERSRSIKVPNIASHLAGVKKIQQVLSTPGVLESLLPDKSSVERIRATFVGLYSLEGDRGSKAKAMAIKNPENFVLKPPREGGGNNLFGEEIRTFLNSSTNNDEKSAYILMDRIFPPAADNCIIAANNPVKGAEKVISELGIFGVYISRGPNEVISNYASGYLLRTKNAERNEGGIGVGAAALDSVYLV
ncbi:Glutathione synthetase [Trichoplax sp. H2]|nr:Glutathione synthetase [Trichoplax sp. H2]|eukprot:RDD41221.1 Glutathione synthetase [Trichoplax sp. H2]